MDNDKENLLDKLAKTLYILSSSALDTLQAIGAAIIRIAIFGVILNEFWDFAKVVPGLHTVTDRQVMELLYIYSFVALLTACLYRLVVFSVYEAAAVEKRS